MRLLIPGRLPCMNDLINANRLNKYAGAGVKKKTQRQNLRDYGYLVDDVEKVKI
ncbi:hypothetical protein [Dialister invisus]|uniref:hypothetical protein n=1 Tax=Dialister invisus TaxID=218538 RepID=UPI0028E48CB9|nr:hypothetical protein [Dialister invisus]